MNLTSLPMPEIPDDLLSAYLDNAVTPEERRRVEDALEHDPEVTWRLNSLRHTVQLLRALPPVALPRAFSLEAILASERALAAEPVVPLPVTAPQSAHAPTPRPALRVEEAPGFWERLAAFFGGGSPLLRNAAAAAFALFLVVLAGSELLSPRMSSLSESAAAPAAGEAVAMQAAEEAAPAPEGAAAAEAPAEEAPAAEIAPAGEAAVSADEAAAPAEPLIESQTLAESAAPDVVGAPEMAAPMPAPESSAANMAADMAAPPMAAPPPLEDAIPPGMGGVGGGGESGPGALPQDTEAARPGVSGGSEAETGLDAALAEAASAPEEVAPAAFSTEAVTDATNARIAPAESAAAAPAAEADTAAEATPAEEAATITVEAEDAAAKRTEDQAPTPVTGTPIALAPEEAAPAQPAEAQPSEPLPAESQVEGAQIVPGVSQPVATALPWLLYAQVALAGLALLFGLLWLFSRRARP